MKRANLLIRLAARFLQPVLDEVERQKKAFRGERAEEFTEVLGSPPDLSQVRPHRLQRFV